MTRNLVFFLAAANLGLGCAALQQQRIRAETKLADALVSDRQEEQIGKEIHQQLKAEGVQFVTGDVASYVEGIAERVYAEANRQDAAEDIQVYVIDDDRTVNAFAVPGGRVYFYSGLLLEADNAAEVAAVVSHEGGHVLARHSARQMVYAYGYDAVASLALGDNPSLAGQIAAQVIGTGMFAQHSQSEESEADRLGLGYMSRAGYDPRGMVTFFKMLKEQEGSASLVNWFSSHPTTESRIDEVRGLINSQNLDGGELGKEEHEAAMAVLRSGKSSSKR